jgi:deoxyinosine 3'endonuclease (endonuclease V)
VGTFEVPGDNIVTVEEWMIEVRYTLMIKQQRKKVEGGGFVEVPTVGVALRLSNPAREEAAKKARETKERLEREERARREAKRLEELRSGFQEELARKYVGKKIVRIDVYVGGLDLTFEDDSGLSIALAGEPYEEMWVEVDNTSLSDFEYRHPSR